MKYLLLFLLIFFIGLIAQNRWILLMQTRKMGQNIKDYGPKGHVIKAGTPSMGGVPFLLVAFLGAILGTLAGFGSWIELLKLWSYPLL
nr:phospho-N-acetylmuramoyl-pentapeptide-transferase [Synergistaceae bacterium]